MYLSYPEMTKSTINGINGIIGNGKCHASYAGALTVKTVFVCASNGFKRNTQPSGGADADASFLTKSRIFEDRWSDRWFWYVLVCFGRLDS